MRVGIREGGRMEGRERVSERERGGGTERSHLQLCLKTLTVAPESLAPVTIEAWFNSLLTIRVPCNMRQFTNTRSPTSPFP